ncbi:MAG: S8 family serine peptidase [Saprospiraceae bacterium]|nr:S8 family serine peptidase [Saprospiraceae bacterium]
MISAEADMEMIRQIAERDDVREIIEDGSFKMLEMPETDRSTNDSRLPIWNVTHIGAPSVWALGYNGQNVVIGGQDTGYAWEVSTIKSKYRGWNGSTANHDYNWHDAIHMDNPMSGGSNSCGFNSTIPCDDNNHGTHTMGTMVGHIDDMGNEIGVAPGAKWIGCRNMENGYGTLTTYTECFEWFLAPYPVAGGAGDPTKMPHVINNSWGCPTVEGCNSTNFATMESALNILRTAGCVIVVSAGNSGPNCNTVNDPAAIFSGSFSVGATNSSDGIAGFSSRGAVSVDGSNRLKPNISAPGVDVRSCLKDGNFANWPGTSMAGPHVAGLVALIISANPELAGEVDKIEDIIEHTAVNLTTSTQSCNGVPGTSIPNNTYGYGRIDALAAVNIALPSNYTPYIKHNESIVIEQSVNGVILVSPNGTKYRLNVNNSGQITVTLITNLSVNMVTVKNSSLNMENNGSKIIFKTPNGKYWALNLNDFGALTTIPINTLPANHNLIATGDVYVENSFKGLLMRSPDNTCFLNHVSNLGKILTIPAICPN